MKFGLMTYPTDESIGVVELGRAAEGLGFESLFVPDHSHIPVSRRTPWPGGGEDMPRHYARFLDPFVALSAIAAVTSTLTLGTGICIVPERDPIITAKEVASVDLLSGGRMLFGVGAGWNIEEMENHGTDPRTRWKAMREQVLAMKQIWTQDEAKYHGAFVNFDPIWSWPKPVQKPHPPILVGGNGPHAIQRVLDYGDEWGPTPADRTGAPLAEKIAELNARAAERGRGPIPVSIFAARPHPATIERYQRAGVFRLVFNVPSADAATVLPALQQIAEAARTAL